MSGLGDEEPGLSRVTLTMQVKMMLRRFSMFDYMADIWLFIITDVLW